jgi:hypothetical protein
VLKLPAVSAMLCHVTRDAGVSVDGDLTARLRADLVAAGFTTETGEPNREAFAETLARRGRMSYKTARRFSYRWTALERRAVRLSSKNALLVARILGTEPERYLYLPDRTADQFAAVQVVLADIQSRLQEIEARLQTLEAN